MLHRSAGLFWLGLILCASAFAAPQKIIVGDRHFFIDGTPTWVNPQAPAKLPTAIGGADQSLAYLLADHQILAAAGRTERFRRFVMTPRERAGLERASHIEIQFNPEYEDLVLHDISVVRAGKRINKLDGREVKLIQREPELERRLIDGVVSAVVVLSDIRIGDQVDYSYSINGDNPVIGKKLSYSTTVGFPVWLGALHVRVRSSADRNIAYRTHGFQSNPTVTEEGGFREQVWRFMPTPIVPDEDAVPIWHFASPWLQLAEYGDWAEVAQWASGLFTRVESPLAPELEALLADWKAKHTEPAERVRAVLDFVQQEIRYFAIALGESSHRPHHPNIVIQRRYGDCKDKSLLMVTLLRRLGIEAYPALVSLHGGRAAEQLLPTPSAFDHVIVQVRLGESLHWLDPTRAYQSGPVASRGVSDVGRALVVADSVSALTSVDLPAAYRNGMHVDERITIRDWTRPASLEVKTTYFGEEAEKVRSTFATAATGEIGKRSLEFYLKRYPDAELKEDLRVEENSETGALTVYESYALGRLLEYRELRLWGNFEPWALIGHLRLPRVIGRKAPLALPYPNNVKHTFTVEFPEERVFRPGEGLSIRDGAVVYRFTPAYDGRRLSLHYELTTLVDAVRERDIAKHLENRRRMLDALYYKFSVPVASQAQSLAASKDFQPLNDARRASSRAIAQELSGRHRSRARLLKEIIEGKILRGENLAKAYAERATVLSYLDEHDAAFADIEKSIAAHADNAEAFLLRGELNTKVGRFDLALKDFETADGLQADRTRLSFSRGHTRFYMGDYSSAASEFEKALAQSDAADAPFKLLWLYWATLRAGKDVKALGQDVDRHVSKEWPGAVLSLVRGDLDPNAVIAAARHDDKRREHLQLCEAFFYAGQHYLMGKQFDRAREMFERSVATDVRMYLEHGFAKIELQRLKDGQAN